MKKRTHYILLFCMLALSAVCGILIPKVNVNSDMTRYLPDDSQMKQGLDIVTAEFGGTQMTGPAVRLMFRDVASSRVQGITDTLSSFSQVKAVSHSFSEDGQYVLFELNVPNSVDQKLLGQEISSRFEDDIVVETSQDGNTPPASVMIIAAALILIILVAMAQSWLEPLIFLISTGLAVVMNIGTNALLPSVSITTNYIVAILQMVLSLDYSIVLMNRYRQEKTGENSPVEAVNRAIKRAFPSIMSSAATTVVGLVMLVFMRLKIGMDMGVVLAKGVIFSLVCTFTVLPSLLMIFQKGVMNTGKKTFVLPTNRISRMVTRYKIPLACAAIVLFFFAFFQSKKTDISFSMERESEINSVFPQHNPFVVVYPTAAESSVPALADSLLKDGAVEGVYAYPTVMRRQYTSSEMAGQIQTMASGFKEELPKELDSSMFTASMMSLVYHMKFEDDPSRQISFPELLGFIREHCVGNPMFDSVLDDDMREKLALLDMYAPALEEEENVAETGVEEAPAQKPSAPKPSAPKATAPDTPKPAAETAPAPVAKKQSSVRLSSFLPRLAEAYPSMETAVLASLSDRTMNNTPMAAPAMSEFIGSTPTQTRMVYSFSKNKSKQMTPYEYVHFLYDDLFNRKALASFVSEDQKEGLRQRMNVMDLIQKDASLEFSELYSLLRDFGA
ncbi:MAG: MMPL family transporter, partial [Candidatus Cryptobacteroides sp.]|nr:MMPL family transporter [Candidatus Cryptobacteroides sp.]